MKLTLFVLQFTGGGVPDTPELFLTPGEAGAKMVEQARGMRHPLDHTDEGTKATRAEWKEAAAGELFKLQTESGDDELRLWKLELPLTPQQTVAIVGSLTHGK